MVFRGSSAIDMALLTELSRSPIRLKTGEGCKRRGYEVVSALVITHLMVAREPSAPDQSE